MEGQVNALTQDAIARNAWPNLNPVNMVTDFFFFFLFSKLTAYGDCSHEVKRYLLFGRKVMRNIDSVLKSRDNTVRIVKAMVFPVVMCRLLDHREGWALKNWCLQIVVLEKILESPLGSKEIKPVHPKGNQPWTFTGRTGVEAEAPIIWPPDAKSWLIREDLDAGKDWGQEEKGMTEEDMVEWHHWLDGHESEQTPGNSGGQRSLACWIPWSSESDTTSQWNNNNKVWL